MGSITKEYTAWCGYHTKFDGKDCCCPEWEQISSAETMKEAKQEFVNSGWKFTIDNGWTCSKCVLKKI